MKKLVTLSIVLLFFLTAKGQGTFIGISGGLSGCIINDQYNISATNSLFINVKTNESGSNNNLQLRAVAGINANFILNNNFSFQSDILLEDKAYSYVIGNYTNVYLQFNELLRYTFTTRDNQLKPFFELGPYFSYLLNGGADYNYYNNILWGFTAGTGVNIPYKHSYFSVRLEYDQNITNAVSNAMFDYQSQHGVIQHLYYRFFSLKCEFYLPLKLKFLKRYS